MNIIDTNQTDPDQTSKPKEMIDKMMRILISTECNPRESFIVLGICFTAMAEILATDQPKYPRNETIAKARAYFEEGVKSATVEKIQPAPDQQH